MDIVIEILIEVFMELMMLVVPKENIRKKHKIIAGLLAGVFALLVLGLFYFGYYLVFELNDLRGILPLAVSLIVASVQIVLGIIFYIKRNKQ